MHYYINVILPIPLVKLFTYSINEAEANFLKPGMRVAVPFGKSKVYTAIVHSVHQNAPETYEAKEIHQILDEYAVVNNYQLQFWNWISEYYLSSLGEVMRASLPSAFLLESETLVSKTDLDIPDNIALTDDEFIIIEALQQQSVLKIVEVSDLLSKKNALKPIKSLIEKGYVKLQEELFAQYKPKLVKYVRLTSDYNQNDNLSDLLEKCARAPKQKSLIMMYFSLLATKKNIKAKALIEKAAVSAASLKALVDKSIFEFYYIQSDRVQFSNDVTPSKTLNSHQEKALQDIQEVVCG